MRRQFLSTYPVRGTTSCSNRAKTYREISIHVPRAGYDKTLLGSIVDVGISIHVPRAGYDLL